MHLFEGNYFKTRQIKDSDAEFIFNLRRSDRAYGLNPISSDIQEQRDFIEKSNQQTKNIHLARGRQTHVFDNYTPQMDSICNLMGIGVRKYTREI